MIMFFDMPLEQLKTYLPPRDEPPEFDTFWEQTLVEARSTPLNAVFEPVDYGAAVAFPPTGCSGVAWVMPTW
jgi:cephalosporin-C deacetylase